MINTVRSQIQGGTQPRARKRKKHTVQTRTRRSPSEQDVEFFLDLERNVIKWPANASSSESQDHVAKQQTLEDLMGHQRQLFNLCKLCLTYNPKERITAKDALRSEFLGSPELRVRYLRKGIDVLQD